MDKISFRHLNLPNGSHILDLGCYNGKKNAWMRKRGFSYRGIDLQYEDAHIEKADFVPWLQKNKKHFDLIILEFSLQQILRKNVKQVLKNIKRNLNSGGYLLIASFNEADKYGPYFSQEEYFRICKGFNILLWRSKKGLDRSGRSRSITEIILRK